MRQALPFPARPSTALRIHPTAIVDSGAILGEHVDIGPYCTVEAGAQIGDRTRLIASVHVSGCVTIGADCELHAGAIVGQTPQIRRWEGRGGSTVVGPRTIVREHVTINRASTPEGTTAIGADNYLMSCSHIAHDCRTADGVTVAGGARLAGFVTLGRQAFISGNVVVHQFVQIGALAMVGGNARVSKDVPPFMLVVGDSRVCGVNIVGLRRAGLSSEARAAIRRAYKLLYRSGLNVTHAFEQLKAAPTTPDIDLLLQFIAASRRGLCAGRRRSGRHPDVDE